MARRIEHERFEFLAAALDSTPDGLILLDARGRFHSANAAAERIAGVPRTDAARWQALPFLRDPASGRPLAADVQREVVALRPDGSRVEVSLRTSPIRDPSGAAHGVMISLAEVTGARRRERARQQSDARFWAFMEKTPNSVIVVRQGNVVFANDEAVTRLGYERRDELVGRPLSELVHPDDRELLASRLRLVEQTGEALPVREERLHDRAGAVVHADVVAFPIHFEDAPAILLFARDLTELKRAEAERDRLLAKMSAKHALLQTFLEVAPVGIGCLVGKALLFKFANSALEGYVAGLPLDGRSVSAMAQEMPELAAVLARVLETGEPVHRAEMPVRLRRAPDAALEDRWLTFGAVRVKDPDEGGDTVWVIALDTTEQVRARQEIQRLADENHRRNAEARGILENIVEGVMVCDADRRVTYVNREARALFATAGVAVPERLTEEFARLFDLRQRDGRPISVDEMPIVRALAGEHVDNEDRIVHDPRRDRDVYLQISAGPIRDAGGRIVGAVSEVRDVSELTELDRLKDQFIRVAAHELKTPVTVMKGFALALLRSARGLTPELRRSLEAIDRGAMRIERIVGDLLDISRLDLGTLELLEEPVALDTLVEEVVAKVALATKTHQLEITRSTPVVVRGDREWLAKVIENLLDNAVRYSPGGGAIEVAVALRADRAEVSVTDQGVGIPRERQRRIFERFYRAHTDTPYDYGGLGVGLYISRRIVARHGGELTFESSEGKGSTFLVSLPLTGAASREDAIERGAQDG